MALYADSPRIRAVPEPGSDGKLDEAALEKKPKTPTLSADTKRAIRENLINVLFEEVRPRTNELFPSSQRVLGRRISYAG